MKCEERGELSSQNDTHKHWLMLFYNLKEYIEKEEVKHWQNVDVITLWMASCMRYLTSGC